MKKKIYYTAGILPIAAGILASFLTADSGYLLLTACFLCCYLPVFSGIRKKYEDDLIQISDILEQLIQGNGSPVTTETADSLVSKLQHPGSGAVREENKVSHRVLHFRIPHGTSHYPDQKRESEPQKDPGKSHFPGKEEGRGKTHGNNSGLSGKHLSSP